MQVREHILFHPFLVTHMRVHVLLSHEFMLFSFQPVFDFLLSRPPKHSLNHNFSGPGNETICWDKKLVYAWVVRPKVQLKCDQKTLKTLTLSTSPACPDEVSPRYLLGLQEPGFCSSKGKGGRRCESLFLILYLKYILDYYLDYHSHT
jgi:hypothetical protein